MIRFSLLTLIAISVMSRPALAQDTEIPLGSGLVFAPYGQLHFAYQGFDDGADLTETIVDGSTANSRVGFYMRSEGPLSFQFETGLGFRPSSGTSQLVTPDFWDWKRTDLRKLQLFLETDIGRFRIGQGSMPTDGAAEADLGGTVVVAKSTIPEGNGDYVLRSADGAFSDIAIGDVFDNLDGSRRTRIYYETPDYRGLKLETAYGVEVLDDDNDDTFYDAALTYAGSYGALDMEGAVGVAFVDDGDGTTSETVGSFAVLHGGSGLNLSVAAGRQNDLGGAYVYLKPGWNAELLAIGTTKFAAELFLGRDYETDGSESMMLGLGVIQDIDAANLEVYAGWRGFSYEDRTGVDYLDASAIQIGARVRF